MRAATTLLTVLILQAALGYTQYFTGVPPMLVALHVLGATLVWVAALNLVLQMHAPVEPTPLVGAQSEGGRSHDLAGRDLVTRG